MSKELFQKYREEDIHTNHISTIQETILNEQFKPKQDDTRLTK